MASASSKSDDSSTSSIDSSVCEPSVGSGEIDPSNTVVFSWEDTLAAFIAIGLVVCDIVGPALLICFLQLLKKSLSPRSTECAVSDRKGDMRKIWGLRKRLQKENAGGDALEASSLKSSSISNTKRRSKKEIVKAHLSPTRSSKKNCKTNLKKENEVSIKKEPEPTLASPQQTPASEPQQTPASEPQQTPASEPPSSSPIKVKKEQLSPPQKTDQRDSPEVEVKEEKQLQPTLKDFRVISVVGRGIQGRVMLVEHRETKVLLAMKMIMKSGITDDKSHKNILTELAISIKVQQGQEDSCKFVSHLHGAFHTTGRLFFFYKFYGGGELYFLLKRKAVLDEGTVKFLTAELILAIDHLHKRQVLYRDLKLENVMLSDRGHVRLVDFGLSKMGITTYCEGTNTVCGTPTYMAPEMLRNKDRRHGLGVDWWALGVLAFEMLHGLPPFMARDGQGRANVMEQIVQDNVRFTKASVSIQARTMISLLLDKNPETRLGCGSVEKALPRFQSDPFFKGLNWALLAEENVSPSKTILSCCATHLHASAEEASIRRNNDVKEALQNFEKTFTRMSTTMFTFGEKNGKYSFDDFEFPFSL